MKVKTFEFNLFGVNTYVVWDEESKDAAVIDPAMSDATEIKTFTDFIDRNGLKLKYLLCTHLHIDHTFGIDYVESAYSLGLNASKNDDFLGKQRAAQARMFRLRMPEPTTLTIDSEIKDGERFYIGQEYLEAIDSPGSVSFYCPSSGIIFTGDTLFRGSIGRTDLTGGDHPQLIKSITTRLLSLPPQTVVYPGHGPQTTIGYESQYNPYI